ncbi:MAG: single-stranded DNA-binding protein [Deltaproteobacteria bacterium]|nr:single-stranded DNA-binding protein [Deltaproteobacteria bacterium]
MASGFVKVQLIGNLGRDPEVRFAASGNAVANLRVGCTERVRSKEGNWEDKTEWVTVVCFGKTAENAGQYLAKGRQIYAEGRLQTREWNDKDGNKRYSTEVLANQILFLGGGQGRGAAPGAAAPGKSDVPAPAAGDDAPPPLSDDDIPF